MDNIDIAAAIENGRPRIASDERGRQRRLNTLHELWDSYSFQIIVVVISFILLIYTVIGECHWVTSKQQG